MSQPTSISTHNLQLQKKRNARMKDALEEALVLSHSYVEPFFVSHASLIDSRTIKDLVSAVLVDIGALYKASEAVGSFFVN
jgi:DNA mismatch repair protein MSH4